MCANLVKSVVYYLSFLPFHTQDARMVHVQVNATLPMNSLTHFVSSKRRTKRMKFRDPLMIRCNSDASQLTASNTEFLFLSIHSTAKYSMWHRISKANSMFYAKKAFVL